MDMLLPLLRADFSIGETYTYSHERPLSCPISVFGGLQDIHVPQGDLMQWRVQTDAASSLQMFPGDHFYLQEYEQELLQAIVQDLLFSSRSQNVLS